ncbi:uncharacterized protein METZ01_LOCUS379826, partial [marine metagenome]
MKNNILFSLAVLLLASGFETVDADQKL